NITTNGIRTVHWDIVRHGNICGGEPVMGKAIKSVWKYRGQSINAHGISARILNVPAHLQRWKALTR
ncbi:hypothetical protein N8Z01_25285, partial [Enterobacter hormaechei subsp. hoffmannii]|nr:hypothetical protein [Enterobacter hormaechei subsp. hoffmannii]MCU3685764.1 hypothetical protein [Enterobacter hormaechei subsp. hoffmannii]MCU3700006.1 hypothetical protein [Enterobacter hormaechei subsp. hoffmannii]